MCADKNTAVIHLMCPCKNLDAFQEKKFIFTHHFCIKNFVSKTHEMIALYNGQMVIHIRYLNSHDACKIFSITPPQVTTLIFVKEMAIQVLCRPDTHNQIVPAQKGLYIASMKGLCQILQMRYNWSYM